MPRPLSQGLAYFPLDTDFFVNKKITSLRRAHGSVGILTYLSLLSRIYRRGYYYKFESLDELSMDIAEEIASEQIRRVAACVSRVIIYLVGQGILHEGLFEESVLTGEAIQEQYIISALKARRKIKMDVYALVDVLAVAQKNRISVTETLFNATKTRVNAEEMPQRERKENEKEGNNSPSVSRVARGKHGNVFLSDAELEDIILKIPDGEKFIDKFSEKLKRKGYVYDDHHAAILNWWEEDKKIKKEERSTEKKTSFDGEEFFRAAVERSLKEAMENEE